MHILVTNDDGVASPGLFALVQELRKIGKVTVLAPDRNWSASGHVKTLHRPLRVKETKLMDGSAALASDGAPSDCVALALLGLVPEKIDLVVSGINPNANMGHDVTYSGTVTAAMEAAIWGVSGIAVSIDAPEYFAGEIDFSPAAHFTHKIVKALIREKIPFSEFPQIVSPDSIERTSKTAVSSSAGSNNSTKILLNVNVPYLPVERIRGIRITRLGLRLYNDLLDRREDPRGRPYYWIGGEAPTGIPEEGTDFGAIAEGAVSVTPLHLDLTAYQAIDKIRTWKFD